MATFRIRTTVGSRNAPLGVGGKIFASLFYLVFAGIGLVVTGLFGAEMLKGMASWGWEVAECRVLASRVEDLLFSLPPEEAAHERQPYRLAVDYQWERNGRTFQGERVAGKAQFASRRRAEAAAARYPAGAATRCYVDPRDPAQGTLRRPRLWGLLFLCFPLIFVAFGVGGVVATWRGGWRRRPDGVAAPRSQRQGKGAGRGCAVAAFGLFALFGAGFLIPFAIPAVRRVASADWARVPATILWSGVGAHSDDDGTTYSVDVLYEYDHGGERFRGNRYRFFGGSSSGEEGKRRVVERLPPGARVDAWVDPEDPSRAVLDRALGGFMLFAALPLVFLAVGIGGMVVMARAGPRQEAGGAPAGPGPGAPPHAVSGPLLLQPAKSRLGAFIGMLLFTLVWDGIVGVAIWAVWREGRLGNEGCVTAFLGVFALVGVLLLLALPRQFLALFNPRAELTLSAPPAPGMPVAVSWRFLGAASRIARLTLTVEGREEATYRRGTDSTTEKRTFARLALLDTTDAGQIAGGETLLALPADTMHSFAAPHNQVVWSLKLHGEIANWPDIDDEVTLMVHPTGTVS
jgi:hypothetical protein